MERYSPVFVYVNDADECHKIFEAALRVKPANSKLRANFRERRTVCVFRIGLYVSEIFHCHFLTRSCSFEIIWHFAVYMALSFTTHFLVPFSSSYIWLHVLYGLLNFLNYVFLLLMFMYYYCYVYFCSV